MGWRDRVKKSFADFADKAEGIQNLKNTEKKEKEGLKTTFIHLTQYTQNPLNVTAEGGASEEPEPETPRVVKSQKTPKTNPAQNITDQDLETTGAGKMSERQNKSIRRESPNKPPNPAPEPPGMGPEYERIWNRAWELAEWIDNPDGAPLAERCAKLPELDDLRERMAAIVQAGSNEPATENLTAASDSKEIKQIKPPTGTWYVWKSTGGTKGRISETCPARCKRSGKCYGVAYFKGKPGPAKDCEPKSCAHT